MQIKEETIKSYVTRDGKEFTEKSEAILHEAKLDKKDWIKKFGESALKEKCVCGRTWGGWFDKNMVMQFYRFKTRRNGTLYSDGYTSNVKYTRKFESFEDAYQNGVSDVEEIFPLSVAEKYSKENLEIQKRREERNTPYVKRFPSKAELPAQSGEYITDKGMSTYDVNRGWSISTGVPEFWMMPTKKSLL